MPRKAREIIKLLKKNGFVKVSQNGSHAKYKSFDTGRIAIVPIQWRHAKRDRRQYTQAGRA